MSETRPRIAADALSPRQRVLVPAAHASGTRVHLPAGPARAIPACDHQLDVVPTLHRDAADDLEMCRRCILQLGLIVPLRTGLETPSDADVHVITAGCTSARHALDPGASADNPRPACDADQHNPDADWRAKAPSATVFKDDCTHCWSDATHISFNTGDSE